ncbi:MAG: hypothetical protein HY909_14695 [Deltaproteobacteria bacterium]|nr:hypothetical protein [Deltaproteobacteria bacterium]
MSLGDDLGSLAARLAEPLSADGRTALATLREGDAALFDALLGETVIADGAPDVRGPLRDACHRSTTNYDSLYDTYITDRYVYAQPLIEVLAAAPAASRAAALRDELTSLRLRYAPPTTSPEHVVDLRPLRAFPRLRSLEVQYPCVGGASCGSMRALEVLSLTRGFDELTLPPWLKRLELFTPDERDTTVQLEVARSRSLRELTVDAKSAARLNGVERLSGLRSLTFKLERCEDGDALSTLLSRVSPTLTTLRLRGVTAQRLLVPARMCALAELHVVAYDLTLETLPALRSAEIGAWKRIELHPQPALRELTVSAGTDLRALSSCRNVEVLSIEFSARGTPGPFPLAMPALRELRFRGGEDLAWVPCYPTLEVIRVDAKTRVETLPEALRAKVSGEPQPR